MTALLLRHPHSESAHYRLHSTGFGTHAIPLQNAKRCFWPVDHGQWTYLGTTCMEIKTEEPSIRVRLVFFFFFFCLVLSQKRILHSMIALCDWPGLTRARKLAITLQIRRRIRLLLYTAAQGGDNGQDL